MKQVRDAAGLKAQAAASPNHSPPAQPLPPPSSHLGQHHLGRRRGVTPYRYGRVREGGVAGNMGLDTRIMTFGDTVPQYVVFGFVGPLHRSRGSWRPVEAGPKQAPVPPMGPIRLSQRADLAAPLLVVLDRQIVWVPPHNLKGA